MTKAKTKSATKQATKQAAQFCEAYDRLIKPLSYEHKIDIMSHPDWFPVTSLLTVKQTSMYLEHVQAHYATCVQLNFPEDLR